MDNVPQRPRQEVEPEQIEENDRHCAELHQRHRRNGDEVEQQTGQGDALKHQGADRRQDQLGTRGGEQHGQRRLEPESTGPTYARRPDHDGRRRAERQPEPHVGNRQRIDEQ